MAQPSETGIDSEPGWVLSRTWQQKKKDEFAMVLDHRSGGAVCTVCPIPQISLDSTAAKQMYRGLFQLLVLIGGFILVLILGDIHGVLEPWGQFGRTAEGLESWPTDFTRDIRPIRCHSHNDYWRRVPLYSAISAGCISVEADVWLFDRELYVGHSTSSLARNRTLKALYIDPLIDILAKQNPTTDFHTRDNTSLNGVFDTDPTQALTLLIDFKTEGSTTWPYVVEALEPLRSANYLSHWNGTHLLLGPIVVVGTGNTPFERVISNVSNRFQDIFFDAPLDELWEEGSSEKYSRSMDGPHSREDPNIYTTENSYYASVRFGKAIGRLWRSRLSKKQLSLLRGQIRGAHRRGLMVRYWDLPDWPIGLRNHVWDVLMREGVDLLNVDDLKAASRLDWTEKGSERRSKP